jgi:hypothetical protein
MLERAAGIEPATDGLEDRGSASELYPRDASDGAARNRPLWYFWSMMFSENRYPLFGIML